MAGGAAVRFLSFAILFGAAARLIARVLRSASASPEPSASSPADAATQAQQQTEQKAHDVYSIFLSHSGKQKGFVERLHGELWNAGHRAFFDQHSIPIGVPFPKYIKEAAAQTKVGLVILSDDFMSSKWPMLELDLLTKSSAEVIPLFYKLSPKDLKSPAKLSEWRKEWKKMARKDGRINVSEWEKAVVSLDSFSGEIYRSGASEGDYIKKIVSAICQKLPSPVTYDVSYANGQKRFCQEVHTRFQQAGNKSCPDISMIGIHGIGGLGKTTLCKVMANYYKSAYSGKSAVLEFPSDHENNKVAILNECKYVLKLLTCASDDILEKVRSFDQAVQLMKERMTSQAVFLALDNVWEHSSEEASRILEAGFGAGSKVLVTSRSEQLLNDLLRDCDKACVKPLPTLNLAEAFETFQAYFGADLLIDLRSFDRVVSLCMFSGSYHPLALKALGLKLKVMGGTGNANTIKSNLDHVTLKLQGSNIQNLIKINYDGMSTVQQHMFLDVGVIFRRTGTFKNYRGMRYDAGEMEFEEMCEWLSILYKPECHEIPYHMQQLALSGLLQFEGEGKKRRVVVHDLYVALAKSEAAASSRFLLAGSTNTNAVRWAELERVVLDLEKSDNEMELQNCPKLQLLYARNYAFSRGLQLEAARALRLLKVKNFSGKVTGWNSVPKLAALHLEALHLQDAGYEAWAGQEVCSCVLVGKGIFWGADLQTLELKERAGLAVEEIWGLASSLESLNLFDCQSLQRIPDLGGLGQLRRLKIHNCGSLEEIRGLPSSLESIDLFYCQSLQRIPDLGGLGQLRKLEIHNCASLEEIRGLPTSVESINLFACPSLQRIPDLGGLGELRSFVMWCCQSLEEIRGLPSSLESFDLWDCQSLQRIPDLGGLGQLRKLEIRICGSLEEIRGLPSSLESIDLFCCQSLQRIPSLGGLGQLRNLQIYVCGSLEEIGGLASSLESIDLYECQSLQRIPDLGGLGQLSYLKIEKCGSLEEIRGLPSSLETIDLCHCQSLQRIPDLGGLRPPRKLRIYKCGSLKALFQGSLFLEGLI